MNFQAFRLQQTTFETWNYGESSPEWLISQNEIIQHDSTIRKRPGTDGIHGRTDRITFFFLPEHPGGEHPGGEHPEGEHPEGEHPSVHGLTLWHTYGAGQ